MIADLGTRRCSSIQDINQSSTWINGYPWMKEEESKFPAMSTEDIKLNNQDINEVNKEAKDVVDKQPKDVSDNNYFVSPINTKSLQEVGKRHKFSNYLIDPNHYQFSKVVRIIAMVQRFIKNCRLKKRIASHSTKLSYKITFNDEEINNAEKYFYRLAQALLESTKVHQDFYGKGWHFVPYWSNSTN